jgi:hypothetical protein
MGIGEIGIELGRPGKPGQGIARLPEALRRDAVIVVVLRRVGRMLQGLFDERFRGPGFAPLQGDDAQEMPGLGRARIGLEDRLLGVVEATGAVLFQGLVKGGCHGRSSWAAMRDPRVVEGRPGRSLGARPSPSTGARPYLFRAAACKASGPESSPAAAACGFSTGGVL